MLLFAPVMAASDGPKSVDCALPSVIAGLMVVLTLPPVMLVTTRTLCGARR